MELNPRITKPEDRDLVKEADLLNDFVLVESQSFFERMLGSARTLNAQDAGTQLKSAEVEGPDDMKENQSIDGS